MHPIRVYLDSSDFSNLSEPEKSAEQTELLVQLREWIDQKKIVCCFSGIHLSEMAPVEVQYSKVAERRASFLADLCGRNAMISIDRLLHQEFSYAQDLLQRVPDIYVSTGVWYPEGASEISPVREIDAVKQLKQRVEGLGLNRKARRFAATTLLRGNRLRPATRASFAESARSESLAEILDRYPMREEDARVLARYALGDANAQAAQTAFESTLRDPRWLMKWFANHYEKLSPLVRWIRAPGARLTETFEKFGGELAALRVREAQRGTDFHRELNAVMPEMEKRILVDLAKSVSEKLGIRGEWSRSLIEAKCPGFSTGFHVAFSITKTLCGDTSRKPKKSDFADAIHAMYAPYVDIFRADSFMAPLVARHTDPYGTSVVRKLLDLPAAIRERLLQGRNT